MPDLPACVEVPTPYGGLLLPAEDRIIMPTLRRTGQWAPQEGMVLQSVLRPGGVFVDVGAHVGYMSMLASHLVGSEGRVVAFEPNPNTFPLLQANAARVCPSDVVCVQAAAWSYAGRAKMSLGVVDGGNTGDNRAYQHPDATDDTLVDIQRTTLDEALLADARTLQGRTVSLIKMDVQGTEAHAVRGASRLLGEHRPMIITEFWPQGTFEAGEDPRHVLSMYRSFGYEIRVLGAHAPIETLTDEKILQLASRTADQDLELLLIPGA